MSMLSAQNTEETFTYPTRREAAQSMPARCTYADCLMGRANVPSDGPGKALFKILMVGGMVTFMATINGIQHSGLEFFATSHWLYPLVFCVAFLVRTFIGDGVIDHIAPRYIIPNFRGFGRTLVMTLANVAVMGTVMGLVMTALLNGFTSFGDFAWQYVSSLPLALGSAVVVNLFIVAPAVKILYNNVASSEHGMRLINAAQRNGLSWMAILNS